MAVLLLRTIPHAQTSSPSLTPASRSSGQVEQDLNQHYRGLNSRQQRHFKPLFQRLFYPRAAWLWGRVQGVIHLAIPAARCMRTVARLANSLLSGYLMSADTCVRLLRYSVHRVASWAAMAVGSCPASVPTEHNHLPWCRRSPLEGARREQRSASEHPISRATASRCGNCGDLVQ